MIQLMICSRGVVPIMTCRRRYLRPSPSSGPLHHSRWRPVLLQLVGHKAHVRIDVMEEVLVAGAEIVEPGFARSGLETPMPGHLPLQAKRTSYSRQSDGRQRFVLPGIADVKQPSTLIGIPPQAPVTVYTAQSGQGFSAKPSRRSSSRRCLRSPGADTRPPR
jgi:hypothetical protein